MGMDSKNESSMELVLSAKENSNEYTTLTLWVPKSSKQKYMAKNRDSGRQLSKKLGEMVVDVIERTVVKV